MYIVKISKLLRREFENRYLFFFLGGSSKGIKTCQLENNIETRRYNVPTKRISLLRKDHFNELQRRTTKSTCMTLTRSIKKRTFSIQSSPTSQELETRMGRKHYCLKRCSTIFRKKDYKEMAKDVYTELLNFLTIFVKGYTEDLAEFLQKISDERSKKVNSLNIHEWKTKAMRNVLTKGFGCVGQNIRFYLKNDNEKERTSVSQNVKKYLNNWKVPVGGGDLLEILERNVYKWGATAPYLRKGKCIGFEDEGSLFYLTVDTQDFAKGGDTGAIVCVDEDVETGLAAFVIVAGSANNSQSTGSSNSESSYLVYKVFDALDKVSEMKPCLIPRTIPISSPVIIDSIQSTSKRKRPDDVSSFL
ncbi:unnamed protein product [Mytilus coruscus]|uniref:Uncharacterized protein n=1 Tax=Mytilus coruscus TaxID=42192 RepID=A0A6J8A0D3_MYTCO|nr:unnamed protein product [Mytilus coruscus]